MVSQTEPRGIAETHSTHSSCTRVTQGTMRPACLQDWERKTPAPTRRRCELASNNRPSPPENERGGQGRRSVWRSHVYGTHTTQQTRGCWGDSRNPASPQHALASRRPEGRQRCRWGGLPKAGSRGADSAAGKGPRVGRGGFRSFRRGGSGGRRSRAWHEGLAGRRAQARDVSHPRKRGKFNKAHPKQTLLGREERSLQQHIPLQKERGGHDS